MASIPTGGVAVAAGGGGAPGGGTTTAAAEDKPEEKEEEEESEDEVNTSSLLSSLFLTGHGILTLRLNGTFPSLIINLDSDFNSILRRQFAIRSNGFVQVFFN